MGSPARGWGGGRRAEGKGAPLLGSEQKLLMLCGRLAVQAQRLMQAAVGA